MKKKPLFSYDFSQTIPSGQTLYFRKNENEQTVNVVCPSGIDYWNVWHDHDQYYTEHERPEGKIVVPASVSYNGVEYAVTGLGHGAFYNCSGITEIVLPETLRSIGDKALFGVSIKELTIPKSVNHLGSYAVRSPKLHTVFFNPEECKCEMVPLANTYLQNIVLGNNIRVIGNRWFHDMNLTEIVIPDSVEVIQAGAFWRCEKLKNVKLSKKLKEIHEGAFAACSSLETVHIPASVVYLAPDAFSDCKSIVQIVIDQANPHYANLGAMVCNKAKDHLVCFPCGIGGDVVVPSQISTIGPRAFEHNVSATSITIQGPVEVIEEACFWSCGRDTLLTVTLPATVKEIRRDAFEAFFSLRTIHLQSKLPPKASTRTFGGVISMEKLTLQIPKGTSKEYLKKSVYRKFGEIIEL